MDAPSGSAPSLSVAIVGICGAGHLSRCLAALHAQEGAPPFEIVVAYDPALDDVAALAPHHPDVRMVANEGQRTPLELAGRALREARGEVILLTEDHCIPSPHWVARLAAALPEEAPAVGGSVEVAEDATATDFAFYFVDFFRYAPPITPGPSPTLTVCNVAYRRACLEAIAGRWRDFFHETAVNDALRERFGPLGLVADAPVRMRRHVRLGDALYERYAFGRLFGCTRLAFASPWRRALYTLGAPALPLLLLARMAAKALPAPALRGRFLRALPALTGMVLTWTWGEWLGYLTRRRPRRLTVAPETAG